MTREELRAFASRDWARIAGEKTRAWKAGKHTPADDLRAAGELRRYVLSVRPDWPSPSDRAEDLQAHIRMSEALRATRVRSR